MKRNPAEQTIRDRMASGGISADGFLGSDPRNIADIVAADTAEIEAAGLTVKQIAQFLDEVHEAADRNLEAPVKLFNDRVTARLTEVKGRIPCPFGCGHRAHKAVIEVRMQGKTLMFTPLHVHLLREHGFLQGKGALFRLEPRDLIALYRMARGDEIGDEV
jgi:hypothetical protein